MPFLRYEVIGLKRSEYVVSVLRECMRINESITTWYLDSVSLYSQESSSHKINESSPKLFREKLIIKGQLLWPWILPVLLSSVKIIASTPVSHCHANSVSISCISWDYYFADNRYHIFIAPLFHLTRLSYIGH